MHALARFRSGTLNVLDDFTWAEEPCVAGSCGHVKQRPCPSMSCQLPIPGRHGRRLGASQWNSSKFEEQHRWLGERHSGLNEEFATTDLDSVRFTRVRRRSSWIATDSSHQAVIRTPKQVQNVALSRHLKHRKQEHECNRPPQAALQYGSAPGRPTEDGLGPFARHVIGGSTP